MSFTVVMWLSLAFSLFIACAVLLVFEIFVPSFGLITVGALACLGAGIAICFTYGGNLAGTISIAVALVVIPVVWIIVYRIFPRTPFGRHIMLGAPDRLKGDAIPDCSELEALLGKSGVVLSPLRPVGMCDFGGKRIECVAETGYIDTGSTVRVIDVEGTQLTVRLIEED